MKHLSLGTFAAWPGARKLSAGSIAISAPDAAASGVQHRPRPSKLRCLVLIGWSVLALLEVTGTVAAHDFVTSTHLLDVRQGSMRSDVVRGVSRGGYELAGGTQVDFSDWYSSVWTDVEVDFLTEISGNLGLIWGISTGERGEKYRISPGLKIGFLYSLAPTPNSALSLSASTRLGSLLREEHCMADYGEIGGVQPVNCRLAASILEPAETLKYDLRLNGFGDTEIALAYELSF